MLTPAVRRKPAQLGLILLMIFGGFMLWCGNPVIWLWIGSQLTTSQSASFGPYALVAVGILASTTVTAMALARVNRAYERVSGTVPTVRVRLPWLRSLRDEPRARTLTVFDAIIVLSGVCGVTAAAVWFLFLAGSSLPGG